MNVFPWKASPSYGSITTSVPALDGLDCVHGHFPLRKYLSQAFDPRNVFMAWLREPLRRQVSQFYYWKQLYPHPVEKFINRVVEEDWDIERFCLHPAFADYQTRYLARFPWWRINFVGVTENYVSDLAYFARHVLRREMNLHVLNETKKPEKIVDADLGSHFLRRFEAANRLDYRNYRKALRASDARARAGLSRRWFGTASGDSAATFSASAVSGTRKGHLRYSDGDRVGGVPSSAGEEIGSML